jgi:chromosome segregation ATPase
LQATEEIFTEQMQEKPSRQKQVQPLLRTLRSTCLAGLQEMSNALDHAEVIISKHHKAEEQKDAQISKLRSEMARVQIDGAKTVSQVKDEYETLFKSFQTEVSNKEAKFVERIQVLEATSASEESVEEMRAQMEQKEALVEKYSTLLKEQNTAWTKMTQERDELEATLRASIDSLKASLTKQEHTNQSAAAEFAALRMKFDKDFAAVELELEQKLLANKTLEAQVSASDNDVSVLRVEIASYRYVYVYVYVYVHTNRDTHTYTSSD